jgi:hypothetical protein
LWQFTVGVIDTDGKFIAGNLGINVNLFKELTASVVDFSCKLATGANNAMVHLRPVSLSLTPVVHLEMRISWQIFEKNPNGAKGIIRGRGEDKSKTDFKNLVTSLFKYFFHYPFSRFFNVSRRQLQNTVD